MNRLEIVVGTYEEFLLGYRFIKKDGKDSLHQTFADKSHSAAIRCLGILGHWVATGSADDRIFVYDMKARKQSQIVLTHEGTVNSLAFVPEGSHLLSVSDDGDMIATRLNTWITEAKWKKAHKGSHITHVSCHPSGKMALSLGSDLVLRTWNLVKGRVAYKKNLKSRNTLGSQPDCLAWSLGGDYFSLTGFNVIEIWSIKTADVVYTQKTTSKPVSLAWISNEICLVGLENGKVQWINLKKKDQEQSDPVEVHKGRVKAMSFHENFLVTACSNGEIKLWTINVESQDLVEVAATNIGCRPTCIGILDLSLFTPMEVLANNAVQKAEKLPTPVRKPKPEVRGVVKVEYENDDDNVGINSDESNSDDHEEEEEEKEEVDENEESEEEEEAANSSSEEDDSDSDKDEETPQIRLPKSRKHKQLISKQKEVNSKKFKTDVKPKFIKNKRGKK